MRRLYLELVLLAATVFLVGCGPPGMYSLAHPRDGQKKGQAAAQGDGNPLAGIPRVMDKIELQNYLRETAIHYNQYCTFNRRPPQTEKEFMTYIRREPQLTRIIKKKYIVLVTGMRRLRSDMVIAYERRPGRRGFHVVVKSDRSIHELTTDELKKLLPKKRR